jgi:hypothetical protein
VSARGPGSHTGRPEPVASDALGVARVPVEDLSREDLEDEVRRLRMRLDALRRQRDERIDQILDLEDQLVTGRRSTPGQQIVTVAEWRRRAEVAEQALAALLATRTMRLLNRPRKVYGRLLAVRARRSA